MQVSEELISQWKQEEREPFEGWDFSHLEGRCEEEEPDWDYVSIAKEAIKDSTSVLDIATGGGEIFSEILSVHRPDRAVATEGYRPNVPVARSNLVKHGVEVVEVDESADLPFEKESFDLVLNRHGAFDPEEVARVTKHGGVFLTQQVGGRNTLDLIEEFGAEPKWPSHTLEHWTAQLQEAGFRIKESKAWEGKMVFKDVGALVYYLKAVPWVVEGFSVERHLPVLKRLQKRLEKVGKLEFTSRRLLIVASKERS